MLKNKIALKRIRNIIFLGLVMIIMLGIYNNTIRNSRAEDRVQLTAQMQDKNGLLLSKEIPVEAVKNSDGTYSIELTNLVDGKRVSKYFAGDGTEVTATTGTVLIATADQVVENKVSIQLEYDSKQVSNGTNTVAIYNQTLSSNAVTVSGYVPDATTLSAQEIDVATLSEVALPDSNVTIEKAYDITIANYQPSEYGESVNVSISYNPTSSPIVYHIADDNTVTKIDSVLEGRSVKFTANHFSKYAIATQTSGTTDTATNTVTNTTSTAENTIANTVANTTTNTVANEVTNTVTNTTAENTVANEVVNETTADTEVPVWSKVSSAITETGMDVVIQGTDNANWGYDELTDEKIEVLIDGETADSISETEIEKNVAEKFVEIEKEIDERIDADETLTDEEKTAQKETEKTAAKENLRAEEIKNKIVVKLQNREDIKENEVAKGVKFTVSLSNMEQTGRQIKPETAGTENEEYKPYLEWSGNVGLKIAAGTLTDVYANVSAETIIEDAEKTDKQTAETADKMFRDVIKPEYTYQSSNTTVANNKKSLTVVFDIVDKYFGTSTLTAENITLKIDGIDDLTALAKTLTKVEDIEETKKVKQVVDGTETEQEVTRKIGERYQLVIENLDQLKINDEEYNGPIQLIFAPDVVKDTSENGALAKTITTQITAEVASTNDGTMVMATEDGATLESQITELNYGQYVDYPIDLNEDGDLTNDWKIFYKESTDSNDDGTNVFLIAADYVQNKLVQENSDVDVDPYNTKNIYGVLPKSKTSEIDPEIAKRYMFADNFDSKAWLDTSNALLETSNWDNFKNGAYAQSAVGGPTVEMWIESWNALYPTEEIYYGNNNVGYYMGTDQDVLDCAVDLNGLTGSSDTLFFPREGYGEGTSLCYGYFLAAPLSWPSRTSKTNIGGLAGYGHPAMAHGNYIRFSGKMIGNNETGYENYSVRPVICLISDVKATQNGDVWNLEDREVIKSEVPIWQTKDADIDFEYPTDAATKDGTTLVGTGTATLIGGSTNFDETFYTANPIETSDLVVYADGVEVTEGITVELLSQKALTKIRAVNGVATQSAYGVEIQVKVSGFTASTKQIRVGLKEGTIQDTNGSVNTLADYTEACIIYNTIQSTAAENAASSAFLGSTAIKRNAITQVIFESSLENINSDTAWNVAAQGDSSIVAWLDASDNTIVHIGSNTPIHANTDSTNLFFSLTNATALTNIDILNTKNVTVMKAMFSSFGRTAMTSLDLGNNFYTKNVTTMEEMFYQCGYQAMETFNIGDNFDTKNVTSMRSMFYGCGTGKLVELDLKEKFYTKNVTDMNSMFSRFGTASLTHLDLGPMFTKITSDSYLGEAGKNAPEETVIDVPEAIYIDENNLKRDETTTTTNVINYTRGTFNLKYYPEWKTTSAAVDGDVLTVVIEGAINENYTANFGANTTTAEDGTTTIDLLDKSDIKVYADGTEVTGLSINVGTANKTVDADGNVTAINYTVEVSGFKAAKVSGDISLGIAARSLKDEYGNSNIAYEVKDESGNMFIETVPPEITYDSSTFDIAYENKTITLNFTVSDNYVMKSIAGIEDIESAEAITALQNAINVILEGEGSTATKALSVEEVLTDGDRTLGAKYKLVLSEFGQYYGTVSVTFPEEIAVDRFDNKSIGTTISIANGQIIDFENPTWEADVRDVTINRTRDGAAEDTVDITFRGLDKEIDVDTSKFNASLVEVWVDGTKVDTISKTFKSQTALTEDGAIASYGMEYVLTLGNFETNSGDVKIVIPTNTLFDTAGLTAEAKEYTIGMVDFIKPVIENISSTLVDADTVQYTFTVTEKNLPDDYELKAEDITIEVDEEDVSDKVTKTLAIASEDANGKTYTLTITKFNENDLSGTVYMTIPEATITDTSENTNTVVARAEGQFIDSVLPEITYKYAAISSGDDVDNPDIDTANQKLIVMFDVTDKHFDRNASDLAHEDIKIAIDGKDVTDEVSIGIATNPITNGNNYTLEISGLENPNVTGNYKDYSGPVQISFAAGIGKDTNGNASVAKNITITDAEEKPIIVDVIAPMWNDKTDITINRIRDGATKDSVDITFTGTDKYIDIDASKFDASLIEVYIDGVKVDSIGKSFKEIKALTEEGQTDPYGIQYTLTLDNFETNTGSLTIVVPANVLKDKNGLVCTESKTLGIKVRRDWRVFYKENADTTGDGVNVFLIASDYLLFSRAASIAEDGMMSGYDSSPYGFDLWPIDAEPTIDQNVKDKFMLTPDYSDNPNEGMFGTSNLGFLTAAYLLDTEKWNIFADSNYATEAIGSPTLEMFAASYNEIMDSLKIVYEMYGTGYGFIYNNNDSVTVDTWIETTNSLFVPHTSKYEGAAGYWLAAPSDGHYRIYVDFEGGINAIMMEDDPYSIRPVVSLKSDIKATKNEETNAWELSTTEGETLSSQITSANYGDYVDYPVVLDEKNAEGIIVDFVKPVVGNITSTLVDTDTVQYTFEITDDYFAETNAGKLIADDITAYVDSDVAEGITKTLTEEAITNGIKYTLTLSGFEAQGLSGTTYIDIPAGKIADTSGNTNEGVSKAEGQFVDLIEPEFVYEYSDVEGEENPDIDYSTKTLTVGFKATDKYIDFDTDTLTKDNIQVKINGQDITDAVTLTLTSTDDSASNAIIYKLVISGIADTGESGTAQITIPAAVVKDTNGNASIGKTITVDYDDGDDEDNAVVVDVVDPIWEKSSSTINRTRDGAAEDSVEVVLKGSDKYLSECKITSSNIGNYIKVYTQNDAGEYEENTSITKTLVGTPTVKNREVEITVKLTNFGTYSGKVAIEVQKNAILDSSGNGNEKTDKIGVGSLTLPLSAVTNDNIGDYIDLGNDIVDFNGTTGVTTDDWRILYAEDTNSDGVDDTVYAILSDYLPTELLPDNCQLIANSDFEVVEDTTSSWGASPMNSKLSWTEPWVSFSGASERFCCYCYG